MRRLLATLTAERGLAGHLIAATLGHEEERTTMHAYAAAGSAKAARCAALERAERRRAAGRRVGQVTLPIVPAPFPAADRGTF